jgi:transgelin
MSRGGGFGLDAEIAAKREALLSSVDGQARIAEAVSWIETLTGAPLCNEDLGVALKDGVLLCQLINAVVPDTIPEKRINKSSMPFKQMENITTFLRAARSLGVPEPDLFETVDLFDGKDLAVVVQCIHSLGSTLQAKHPKFGGPHLGVRTATANRRNFTPEQLAAQEAASSYGTSQTLGNSEAGRRAANEILGKKSPVVTATTTTSREEVRVDPPTNRLGAESFNKDLTPPPAPTEPAQPAAPTTTEVPPSSALAPEPAQPAAPTTTEVQRSSALAPEPAQPAAPTTTEVPPSSASAPTSPAASFGRGCYLVAEETNSGTLTAVWANEVPGVGGGASAATVLAFVSPSKPIPAFKFTFNGGRTELARAMRGPLVRKYYEGWGAFLKLCRDVEGTLTMLPAANDVAVHFSLAKGSEVAKATIGEPLTLQGVKAAAIGPKDSMTFDVGSMALTFFVNKANNEGCSISF